MTDYMKLVIASYRYAKELLRIASEGDNKTMDGHIIRQMSISELEDISKFTRELEEHGILEQIQEVAN